VLLAATAVVVLVAGCTSSSKSVDPPPTQAAMAAYDHQYLEDLAPVDTVAAQFQRRFGHADSVTSSQAGPVVLAYSSFRQRLLSQHWPTYGDVARKVRVVAAESGQVATVLRAGAAQATYRKAMQELDAAGQQSQQLRIMLANLVSYRQGGF
jgi:hypothetical protein